MNKMDLLARAPELTDIEQKFFPYRDMRVQCRYEEVELPEGMEIEIGSQRLEKMTVELFDEQGKTVTQVGLDRIVEVSQ